MRYGSRRVICYQNEYGIQIKTEVCRRNQWSKTRGNLFYFEGSKYLHFDDIFKQVWIHFANLYTKCVHHQNKFRLLENTCHSSKCWNHWQVALTRPCSSCCCHKTGSGQHTQPAQELQVKWLCLSQELNLFLSVSLPSPSGCKVTPFLTQFIFNKLCRIGEHSWRSRNILSQKVGHLHRCYGRSYPALVGLQPLWMILSHFQR